MFDKEAIQQLQEGESIMQATSAVHDALTSTNGALPLPERFKVHDLERFMPRRRRQRGAMKTDSLASFASYVGNHQEDGATVFVSKDTMTATAVLNLGTPTAPGHCDNTATLCLVPTAEYRALGAIVGAGRSQSVIAEFLEDWQHLIECKAFPDDTADISPARAIAAVRNITIEAAKKVESAEHQLSATRSSLESVTAKSKHQLPAHIAFTCTPFSELQPRTFVMRLSIQTGERDPLLILRIVKHEQHQQEMAEEFASLVSSRVVGTPVLIGAYTTA